MLPILLHKKCKKLLSGSSMQFFIEFSLSMSFSHGGETMALAILLFLILFIT